MASLTDIADAKSRWVRAVRRSWRSWGVIALVGGSGIAISFSIYGLLRSADEQAVRGGLELRAAWRAGDLQRKIAVATDSLESLAAFIASQDEIGPRAFRRFAQLAHDKDDANSALFWAPLVLGADRSAFVQVARQAVDPDFDLLAPAADGTFHVAPERASYLPIQYEQTFDPAVNVYGFDIYSMPLRRIWTDQARDFGIPFASPPLPVRISNTETRLGFIVFWPVYFGGEVPATAEERRAKFRGVAASRFRFERLLPKLIADTPALAESFDVLVDRGRGESRDLHHVAAYDPAKGAFSIGEDAAPNPRGSVTFERQFDDLGRHWVLRFHFPPDMVDALRSQDPRWTFLFGLALTALVAFAMQRERTRRTSVERLVSTRTAELWSANEHLKREALVRRTAEVASERSRALILTAFDAAPFSIVVRSLDGRVQMWNRAAEAMFGFRADEIIGHDAPPGSVLMQPELAKIIERLRRGEVIRNHRMLLRRKDGGWLNVMHNSAPIYQNGEITGFCGVTEDVTERDHIELQLAQAQKMEAVGKLTGGMAHDFNNLLEVMVGNLELLRMQVPPGSDNREFVDESLRAAFSGAELIKRLLAFARRQPLAPQRVDLNPLIRGMVQLLSRTLGERIQISLDLTDDVWPVTIDPSQLETCIVNLATNARDAMPSGGHLSIATANHHLDEGHTIQDRDFVPGDYAVIAVTDTGHGMTPRVMSHIFEPFYSTKDRTQNSGLGLSMVFGFLKQSAAYINFESAPGEGTTFRIYLPRTLPGAAEPPAETAGGFSRGAGETVLVVENDAERRKTVAQQLTELGYCVAEAENATDAISILESRSVDVVLADALMPGGPDGWALAERIISEWPRIKIILSTEFPDGETGGLQGSLPQVHLLGELYDKAALAGALRAALKE